MHTTAPKKQPPKRPALASSEDWLDVLCRHRSWNEREVLSVLADVSTAPAVSEDARAKTEAQFVREAPARREAARQHVGDAIANGQLRVDWKLRSSDLERIEDELLRALVQDAIYITTHYDQRHTVRGAMRPNENAR